MAVQSPWRIGDGPSSFAGLSGEFTHTHGRINAIDRWLRTTAGQARSCSWLMDGDKMGLSWNGWFRGTPISGNLQMVSCIPRKLAQLCNPTAKGSSKVPGLFRFFSACIFVSPVPGPRDWNLETQQIRFWEYTNCNHGHAYTCKITKLLNPSFRWSRSPAYLES